ncbi:TolC family protein [Vibrio sp. HN007]|uniref:TolC family protein n=1 Tax=Vibrio iocasae TaxID=3098914 RepID=UPI0035D489BF
MYNNKSRTKKVVVATMFLLLAGCSSLTAQQEFAAKTNEVTIPEQWQEKSEFVNGDFANQLLQLVDKESVSKIVDDALTANYDLRTTAARLKQSRLLHQQAEINEDPSLNTSYEASRAKKGAIANSQTLSLNLSWEIDVWGRLADASDAASATAKASELDYTYARNSLAARVIQAWLDINYRAQIIAVEEQWVTSLVHTEEIIREQVLDGEKEQADLDTAKASTENVRATLAARKQSQLIAIRNLNVLRGQSSDNLEDLALEPVTVSSPPVQVPGNVIGSRPDLIAAYQRILSADKKTSVAYKELLPKFTLTASASRTGETMNQLLDSSSAWNLIGGITAPIFNRDSLKNSARISELDAEIAYLDYQKLMLNALTEVENAFDQEASFKTQEYHLSRAYKHSFESMRNYQYLYQDGASGVLSLLVAKQSAFQAKIKLLETEQARFSNRITLGLALGMGV